MSNIAFIGLGNMGGPMAANLIKKGHHVIGFDLSDSALQLLASAGGQTADSAVAAAKEADIIISMLPSGKHVAELYTEEFISQLKPDTLLIDSSTIDAVTARSVAQLAASKGCRMIDAPVSGGTGGAQAGTLTFIVGGKQEDYEKARPVLKCMGQNIFYAGTSGAGQVAKICNNMLLAIHMIGTSEAINLGIKNGLDPKVLSEIMQKSSGKNWSLEVYNPYPGVMENAPASREYSGGFAVDLMTKDLGLAAEAGLESKTSTPLGNTALNLYRMWSDAGNGKIDFSSIIQFLHKAGN
ncbi:3-hydroxyisobutyrate dehydrogenase [Chryseobacterium indologenes]|uniref:3-hydroxyisobutyrate dehydrogenase n=1 Tax=Chryseobacterium indologenes TaxID=253 RepID=UPI000BFE88DD|nr:3-hydroxyisobutyrate dehydrogenase [Chryseobacterium indologenes]ATN05312.1 3-hydroxyisobutyrate dehydrogenase [Chryseobacterium indologenes]AYY85929.1 3-hydroxyisobutyrate dehydrogenase [Chryseobacterium indologenes]AYZ35699.1 3-hydroxyisobutyrate dehydrogenase [Chryseobacterium indologenes]MBF6644467.1 3-hydroxyisobutyrate dehydrogenase [Chryseobacterium indologenes]MBU3047665.1 3-hydroxyisobutyrate dehydrogenase [Chryseobacterium indologenes]